jgi:hypothetical protein
MAAHRRASEGPWLALHDGQVTADDVRRVIADGLREGLQLEFKREVDSVDQREWAADVSALANTAGGVVLIGLRDEDGRATEVVGVDGDTVDALLQRLGNILRDRVEPALPWVHMEPVEVDGRTVVAVSVPRSWAAPHLVRSGDRWQVARRNSTGKYAVSDVVELRGMFAQAQDVATRIRRWHRDRALAVQTGTGPAPLADGPFMLVTLRSLVLATPGMPPPRDVIELQDDEAFRALSPVNATAYGTRFNLEGIARCASDGTGYVQVHRDASIEIADTYALARVRDAGVLGGQLVAGTLIDAAWSALQLAPAAGQTVPVVLQASIHGVAGAAFKGVPSNRVWTLPDPSLTHDTIELPAVTLARWPDRWHDVATLLRPGLDVMWNAGGHPRCLWFDDAGQWTGPTRT